MLRHARIDKCAQSRYIRNDYRRQHHNEMGKSMSSQLEREILEQPQVLQRLLDEQRATVEQVAEGIRERAPRFIVLAARGSSDNAARYGQYLFGTANDLPVALATPSLFTLYKKPPKLDGALVLGISQSGQSPDIVSVLEEGHRQGALTVAITNDPHSALADIAEHTICLLTGPEQSIAATKTIDNMRYIILCGSKQLFPII